LDAFVVGSRKLAAGCIGFYWGKTPEEYARGPAGLATAITRSWLEYFRAKAPAMVRPAR